MAIYVGRLYFIIVRLGILASPRPNISWETVLDGLSLDGLVIEEILCFPDTCRKTGRNYLAAMFLTLIIQAAASAAALLCNTRAEENNKLRALAW